MGRGLSDLQKYILAEAGRRRRVYYADILMGFFGWKPVTPICRHEEGDVLGGLLGFPKEVITGDRVGELKYPGGQKFSRKGIGEETYRKVMATLSRSTRRLEERGLVTCLQGYAHWSAVEITDKGREWLSVN